MSSAKTLLKFELLLKKYNSIYRDLSSLHNAKNLDNDVEHSYRVAMLCWMLIDEYKFKLDANKVIRYALVHDLPEVYAGDISMYANYSQKSKEKKAEPTSVIESTEKKELPKAEALVGLAAKATTEQRGVAGQNTALTILAVVIIAMIALLSYTKRRRRRK